MKVQKRTWFRKMAGHIMENRFHHFVTENRLIEKGDKIVVGVSGGADSVCLLLLLCALRENLNIEIYPVHVEHGIRGQEAKEDQRFVEELCGNLGLSCHTFTYQVPAYAVKHGMTLEEAGRYLRYQSFEQVAAEAERTAGKSAVKIAVAHHKMDNAETILFHLFRGTGLDGMAGILPKNDKVIRPLADFTRQEIEEYLSLRSQPYCQDSTNATELYARNRIRHVILPEAERICKRAAEHIDRTGSEMAEIRDYMEQETEKKYREVRVWSDSESGDSLCDERNCNAIELSSEKLKSQHPVIGKRIFRLAYKELAGSLKDFSRANIEALYDLNNKQVGKKIQLPMDIVARKTYTAIILEKEQTCRLDKNNLDDNTGDYQSPKYSGELEVRVERMSVEKAFGELYGDFLENGMKNPEIRKKFMFDTCTKWFDYDKISPGYIDVRTRREKDYMVIHPSGERKTLKKFFIDEKIPAEQRGRIPLVTCGNHVLWVYGYRTSQGAHIARDTKEVLKVTAGYHRSNIRK